MLPLYNSRTHSPFLISTAIALVMFSSCRSPDNQSGSNTTSQDQIVSSTPPFQTKEPEHYQAVRTTTFSKPSGESVVTKTLIAKDGNTRRDEYDNGSKGKIVYLDLAEGRFMLLPNAKLYASLEDETGVTEQTDMPSESSPNRLLNADPLEARYQKIGNEIINGRATNKYRVLVNTSAGGAVSNGESLIWIDESLSMPVKSETVTADGERATMELSQIALEVDKRLFRIPEDYKKVAPRAIREQLQGRD
jgi:outer membrane lipoprotein-sorting protein